jgi:hypothetical protein
MRKITLFAAVAALILACVGGWVASTTQAHVADVQVTPIQCACSVGQLTNYV